MPTRLSTSFAPLTDSAEFESLVRDICALEWRDPATKRFGRTGQKQYGVDIYGQPVDLDGRYRAVQCKLRTKGDSLTEQEIEAEVSDARLFPHALETLIIVTNAPRDTHTQVLVDQISEREVRNNSFKVIIWFWDDVIERLAAYPKLIVTYYRDYFASLTTLPIVERLVDTPLQILSAKPDSPDTTTLIDELLKFRGVRVLKQNEMATRPKMLSLGDTLPDGLVYQCNTSPAGSSDSTLLRTASAVKYVEEHVESACPIVVLLPSELTVRFLSCLKSLGGNAQRVQILEGTLPVNELADRIFQSAFDYGYMRRGGFATIDITARTIPSKPSSTFLDLDWQTKLSTSRFPTTQEWEDTFVPALEVITRQIAGLGDRTRIQINSKLPLPAAFALGFFFNIRIGRVGVWARKTGVSDFKRQFWLSDGRAADVTYTPKWVNPPRDHGYSAILELTTHVSIHKAVETFAGESGLTADGWLQVQLDSDVVDIDESVAVAFANQVGGIIRRLNAQGITDIHLFARIPSALAVLFGQRLQACGRIHLYWFDNPTYRFAFTLR
jgi:hypothetical protein